MEVAVAVLAPCRLLFSRLLAPCVATGSIACSSTLLGVCAAFWVEPCWAMSLPPGRMLPEKAAFSDFCSVWYLETLTEEIENSTMNSAISSVIMSAYVSSQRSPPPSSPPP